MGTRQCSTAIRIFLIAIGMIATAWTAAPAADLPEKKADGIPMMVGRIERSEGIPAAYFAPMLNGIEEAVANDREFVLLRRHKIQLLKQLKFEFKLCQGVDCNLKFGQMLSARMMIIPALLKVSYEEQSDFRLSLDLVETETGVVRAKTSDLCNAPCEVADILPLARKVARHLLEIYHRQSSGELLFEPIVTEGFAFDSAAPALLFYQSRLPLRFAHDAVDPIPEVDGDSQTVAMLHLQAGWNSRMLTQRLQLQFLGEAGLGLGSVALWTPDNRQAWQDSGFAWSLALLIRTLVRLRTDLNLHLEVALPQVVHNLARTVPSEKGSSGSTLFSAFGRVGVGLEWQHYVGTIGWLAGLGGSDTSFVQGLQLSLGYQF